MVLETKFWGISDLKFLRVVNWRFNDCHSCNDARSIVQKKNQGCQLEMFQDNRSPQRGKKKSNLMVGSDSRCWMNPPKKYQDLVLHVHLHDTLGYT